MGSLQLTNGNNRADRVAGIAAGIELNVIMPTEGSCHSTSNICKQGSKMSPTDNCLETFV